MSLLHADGFTVIENESLRPLDDLYQLIIHQYQTKIEGPEKKIIYIKLGGIYTPLAPNDFMDMISIGDLSEVADILITLNNTTKAVSSNEGTTLVILDTLDPVLVRLIGAELIGKWLRELMQATNSQSKKGGSQIVVGYHRQDNEGDCDFSRRFLRYFAQTLIRVPCAGNINSSKYRCTVEKMSKKHSDGNLIEYLIDSSDGAAIQVAEQPSAEPENVGVITTATWGNDNPTGIPLSLPFNLSLSKDQLAARSKVELPFMKAQQSRSQSLIFYNPASGMDASDDDEDAGFGDQDSDGADADYDIEEDPDEDLEI